MINGSRVHYHCRRFGSDARHRRAGYQDSAAVARQVGYFAEQTDSRGVRHLRGFDTQGRPYHATVNQDGRVKAMVGGAVIEFTVADAD